MIALERAANQTYSSVVSGYSCVREAEMVLKIEDTNKIQLAKYVQPFFNHFYAVQQLISIKEDRSEFNWNGKNAQPVSLTSLRSAIIFLISTPPRFKQPSPGVAVNGQITLEWRRKDGRLLSLAFDDKGQANYIAFLPDGEILGGTRLAVLGYDEILITLLEKVSQ